MTEAWQGKLRSVRLGLAKNIKIYVFLVISKQGERKNR